MELNLTTVAIIGITLIVLLLTAAYWLSILKVSEDKLVKVLYKRIFSGQDDPIIAAVVNQDNLTPLERVESLNLVVTPETFTEVKETIEGLEIAATLHYNSAADKVQGLDILEEPVLEEPILQEPVLKDPLLEQTPKDYSFMPQADITDITRDWEALAVIEKVGNYELYTPTADTFRWRLISPEDEVLLTSKAEYISEMTCKNGISSANKTLAADSLSLQLTVKAEDLRFTPILRAKNGKLIGVGPTSATNDEAVNTVIKIRSIITA
jgi:uncharacterized protein YegP (UPF0339 family)